MKKLLIKFLCITVVIFSLISIVALAQEDAAQIHLGSTSRVKAGGEAVITIDAVINAGLDVQGIQIEFKLSDNFPKIKKAQIVSNTTGWENAAVSEKKLLAIGNVVKEKSHLAAKITFDIPSDAQPGEEYIFTLEDVLCASAKEELGVKINEESIKVVVDGNKPQDTQNPQDKTEDTTPDDNYIDSSDKNDKQPAENVVNKDTEQVKDEEKAEDKTEKPKVWKNPFSDISEKDWFYDGVGFVFENNLMNGTSNEIFEPHSTLTRGMLVTILYRFEGEPKSKEFGFSDVSKNMWYTKAVDWAASYKIVNGIGNNMFAPDEPVTRQQIAVIFYNYAKYKAVDLIAEKDLSSYLDSGKISSWARKELEWAVASGLISGKSNNILDPSGNATRAETSVIIKRYVENILKNN